MRIQTPYLSHLLLCVLFSCVSCGGQADEADQNGPATNSGGSRNGSVGTRQGSSNATSGDASNAQRNTSGSATAVSTPQPSTAAGGSPETLSTRGGATNGGSGVASTTVGGSVTSSVATWAGGTANAGAAGMTATGSGGCGLLIDDMESQTGLICEGSGRNGAWYAYNDESEKGTQWPTRTVTPGTPIEVSSCDRTPNGHCMHTYGSGFLKWGAGIGLDLNFGHKPYASYDASAYDGITFWAKGTAFDFRASTEESTLIKYGGSCEQETCSHQPPMVGVRVTPEWMQYTVPFRALHADRGGFPRDKITNIQFDNHNGAEFDFWIDDVAFYTNPECCSGPLPQCEVLHFADNNLMEAMRVDAARPTGSILCKDLCDTRGVSASSLVSLSGIECLAQLTHLTVRSSRLTDLDPVAALSNLENVDLTNCGISRIESLGRLTRLTKLELADNQVTDLSPLSALVALSSLGLSNNPVTDISPLSKLVNLVDLELAGCAVSSLAPLDGLSHLKSLDVTLGDSDTLEVPQTLRELSTLVIHGGRIGKLVIRDLGSLRSLSLSTTSVNQVLLESLPSIEYVSVNGGVVGELSMSGKMDHLDSVSVTGSQLKSAMFGVGTEALQSLTLTHNQLKELQLPSASRILSLNIAENQFQSLEFIEELPSLQYVNASSNQLLEVTLREGLASLASLNLNANQLRTISLPKALTKLTELDLTNNALVDLGGLSQQTSLTHLDVSHNSIVDLKPLAQLTAIAELIASDNAIRDLSPLASLAKLRYLNLVNNRISTVAPLVNAGRPIDYGTLLVQDNLLNCTAESSLLTALKARHVNLTSDCDGG